MMNNEDFLISYGSEVKSMPDGRLTGHLIRFSTAGDPDLSGDFFNGGTDYGFENKKDSPVYLNHRLPFKSPSGKTLRVREKIGEATLTKSDDGILIDAILYNHEKYKAALHKMGWSSGTAGHLVDREQVGKAFHVKSWPLGLDASLTWEPCEPRNMLPGSVPLKSIEITDNEIIDVSAADFLKSFEDEENDEQFLIDGVPFIKAYCEAVSPNSKATKSQRSDAAAHAVGEFITIGKILGEAVHSHKSLLVRRTEHRFLRDRNDIDPSTFAQVKTVLAGLDQLAAIFEVVKEPLFGIQQIGERSKTEQKALDEQARFALWNYYRISGYKPEELEDNV
jgi:hypothetical protein